jgi:SAM-dependent methyltransferase
MKILSRATCGRMAWDDLVASSPDGWVWALWDWQELILAVPRWQLHDLSFAIVDGDAVVAAVPLQRSGARNVVSGTGFGLTAPVIREGADREACLRAIFAEASARAASARAESVEFAYSPVSRTALADPQGRSPLERFGFTGESRQSRLVRLGPSDEMLRSFSRDSRQQIRKAQDAGVTVGERHWPDAVDEYYRLHTETYQRTGETPHPREYFAGIAARLGTTGHSILWGASNRDGELIAFHNTARLGTGAMYHTGCSTAAALTNGANYLLMWHAIQGAASRGCEWYEIGEVFGEGASPKQRGLSTFKSKFGGELHQVWRGSKPVRAREAGPGHDLDAASKAKFGGEVYSPQTISIAAGDRRGDYPSRMMEIKLRLIRECCPGPRLLDVCCSTGQQLIELMGERRVAAGVDFSMQYLQHARDAAGATAVRLACGNARALPFRTGSIDAAYSISSLYVIPNVGEVIDEMARVLRPGGRCLLDLGNVHSLNNIVSRAYPEFATPYHVSVRDMLTMIEAAQLRVVVHRSFQLLPMWGDRPATIKWLMAPWLIKLLSRRLGGRMLDEWISSVPGLSRLAFRHVFVCEKRS